MNSEANLQGDVIADWLDEMTNRSVEEDADQLGIHDWHQKLDQDRFIVFSAFLRIGGLCFEP